MFHPSKWSNHNLSISILQDKFSQSYESAQQNMYSSAKICYIHSFVQNAAWDTDSKRNPSISQCSIAYYNQSSLQYWCVFCHTNTSIVKGTHKGRCWDKHLTHTPSTLTDHANITRSDNSPRFNYDVVSKLANSTKYVMFLSQCVLLCY